MRSRKGRRETMIMVAPSLESVWNGIEMDRKDLLVEVETLHQLGPVAIMITKDTTQEESPKETAQEETPPPNQAMNTEPQHL